eukprot:gnl/TRDRNA2_/TRDRNA2_85792_c0_seq1.p1 gnl/TRDRNA2_/TRDRNA2_85792_c0~~gnl/TRDRNA2_/TRDRNA2_85792_c0_seq1.p1  ORF type:complete len:407 (+),score=67.74 gnl/TRDRNA2_/TRDRNA2_85792_c0_seq1:39-1259(+)
MRWHQGGFGWLPRRRRQGRGGFAATLLLPCGAGLTCWAAAAAPASKLVAAESQRRFAFATIATNDYYAQGAFVTLHSISLHARRPKGKPADVDCVLMVAGSGISRAWRQRFLALGVRLVDVQEVRPSPAVEAALAADRKLLSSEGLLEVLQPVPYGGAFAKIHAWDPVVFGGYEKVVLLDGDVIAKRSVRALLEMTPLAAGRDLMDAFNYGVLVLRPDAEIYAALHGLLANASKREIDRYNTRRTQEAGFCDQTLVTGYLATHHGPISFFEDLRKESRKDPKDWVLSTEYNLVVSYRAKERCEDKEERKRVDTARLVHFANNWLHFGVLANDREAPGRIDSPRCYRGAFRYWHDVYQHAMAVAEGTQEVPEDPVYERASRQAEDDVEPEKVQHVFQDFIRVHGAEL